ncbi:MAG TPA: SIR2 family protein [Betaproteobacteria bacterium]|nr:SIR2 family protein [Betaproteobacteria bacterium]
MSDITLDAIAAGLRRGDVAPYLGPGVLDLCVPPCSVPTTPEALVERLTAKATVPFKIRRNLTAAAQYIENFKHRKTLHRLMHEAFQAQAAPTALHRALAALPRLPLIVDAWYDDAASRALADRPSWGQVQGVSHADYRDDWVHYYAANGDAAAETAAASWDTLLYKPLGAVRPGGSTLVSDSDYVEVLTEIDIQTPIPQRVQELRKGRCFLFLGCHFRNQLERSFARQIMKRSSDGPHWAFLQGELTKNERRFLTEQQITRLDLPLAELLRALSPAASIATA